jgi:hypothetical protein
MHVVVLVFWQTWMQKTWRIRSSILSFISLVTRLTSPALSSVSPAWMKATLSISALDYSARTVEARRDTSIAFARSVPDAPDVEIAAIKLVLAHLSSKTQIQNPVTFAEPQITLKPPAARGSFLARLTVPALSSSFGSPALNVEVRTT